MSKKDYQLIAQALKDSKPVKVNEQYNNDEIQTWMNCTEKLTNMLAQNNPSFNRAKFLTACGYND